MVATWVVLSAGVVTVGVTVAHAVRPRARTMWLSLAALGLSLAGGALVTVLGLRHAFAATAHADPSSKATLLAQGISDAMNASAFAAATLVLWVAPFLVGELRRRKARPRTAEIR